MVIVRFPGLVEGCNSGGKGGNPIFICIASIVPDLVSNRWLMVELYRNVDLCNFWCVRLLLAHEIGRYHRVFTGTIEGITPLLYIPTYCKTLSGLT